MKFLSIQLKKICRKGHKLRLTRPYNIFFMISIIFCCKIEFFHYQLMGLMLVMSANAKTIDFIVLHQTWVEKLRLTLPLFLTEKCNLFLRIKNMTRKYQIACKQLLCQSKGKQSIFRLKWNKKG